MEQNKIYFGNSTSSPLLVLNNEQIISVSGEINCSVISVSAPVDYLEADFIYTGSYQVETIPVRTQVWFYRGEKCYARFFLKFLRKVGVARYRVHAESFLWILDQYDGCATVVNNLKLTPVLYNCIFRDGINIKNWDDFDEFDPLRVIYLNLISATSDVWNTVVNGVIPSGTRRERFLHILFSIGAEIGPSTNFGRYIIRKIENSGSPTIAKSRIYNESSIEYVDVADRVELTVYKTSSYASDWVTVYESSDDEPTTERRVFFDSPVDNVDAVGDLEIVRWAAGGAIVKGIGSIKGHLLTLTKWTTSRGVSASDAKKTVSVSGNTLVNYSNALYLLDSLWNYYTNPKRDKIAFVGTGETAGLPYTITDALGGTPRVYFEKFKFSASGIMRVDAECISYTAPSEAESFANYVVLTGSGTWTVPDSVFAKANPRIQVILIGGGNGGQSGLNGARGRTNIRSPMEDGTYGNNKGGKRGAAGNGGRIYSVEISGDDILSSFSYSCGTGGTGGARCYSTETHNNGSKGTDTTFGSLTSASGGSSPYGYQNIFTGDIYGANPSYVLANYNKYSCDGLDGRAVCVRDGWPSQNTYEDEMIFCYISTSGVEYSYTTGQNGGIYIPSSAWPKTVSQYGGLGGGCAQGSNGSEGTRTTIEDIPGSGHIVRYGNGGKGADAYTTWPRGSGGPYGSGGIGGSGGGGGGNAGYYLEDGFFSSTVHVQEIEGTPGEGGSGAPGGYGSDGCVIIYY